jgi:hypothetical protein
MKRNILSTMFLLLGVASTLGTTQSKAAQEGLGVYPEIFAFTATPSAIRPGEPVILTWKTRGTASVTMDSGPEAHHTRDMIQRRSGLPSSGTMTVTPKEDTIFELKCDTVAGPMCLTASVTVRMH